jgi:hypothetical protein
MIYLIKHRYYYEGRFGTYRDDTMTYRDNWGLNRIGLSLYIYIYKHKYNTYILCIYIS